MTNEHISNGRHHEAGLTLMELVVVMLLVGTLAAVSMMVMPWAVLSAKADGGASKLESVLRTAREQAISQRRLVRITFTAPDLVTVTRLDPDGTETNLLETRLEGGMQYQTFDGVGDTPDAFGQTAAISFGGAESVAFSSEGTFVDEDGDEVNGTLFLGMPDKPESARAVTVFGPTALIRAWTWSGSAWVD